MSINVFRKAVIALLISTTLTIAGAAPSQAFPLRSHRGAEEPARHDSHRGLLAWLLHYFFESAGGAMDPNGSPH